LNDAKINSDDVVRGDLDYICQKASDELSELAGKRIAITGGAGFLGYYLVQSLLHWNETSEKDPVTVYVYDNFSRGMPDWLAALDGDDNLKIEKHDIADPLPEGFGPFEYIIHAASIASPIFYRQHPIETMDANVNGLRHLLDWTVAQKATTSPVEGFLFYSTSEIYGDPSAENIPTPETYRGNVSCTGPRACYDESKRYGETLCVNFADVYEIPIRIARPFNNYGPGLKITDGRALPDFARNIFSSSDITMFSDGAPTRTFCYVADAVVGYFKILVRGRNGESYNVGTDDDEISMLGLAELVVELSGELFDYEGKVTYQKSDDADYLVDNPNRRRPIIDKARDELDFDPGIGLRDGVKRSLIWYSGNQEAEES
jgi:dTDP-glucose 4,6-dehydratase/UDP-glucuronate decarboxylase